jgi:putative transposase
MPRLPRLQAPDVLYHVGSRGVEKRSIFERAPRDREVFVDLLDEVVRRFHWRLYAYCLMGNHFHLVLDTPEANLSAGMQHLKGEYAQWLNGAAGREGVLFERRFWSRVALHESFVLELSRYVVLNPVRVGWVRSPEEWIWSSYSATIGLERCPRFLRADDVLAWHGGGPEARHRYARFVRDAIGVPASDEPLFGLVGT